MSPSPCLPGTASLRQFTDTTRRGRPAKAISACLPSRRIKVSPGTPFSAPLPTRQVSTGRRAYKTHPPQSWRDDIKVCEAVRKAVGDDYTVMLDSTWSYRYEEALRVGRAIEEMGFYWYEDPLADQDLYNYVKLKQKLDIPILATEFPTGGFAGYAP